MKWRDFLFFSKGERQALTLLLSLIALMWLVIFYTNYTRPKAQAIDSEKAIRHDTIRLAPPPPKEAKASVHLKQSVNKKEKTSFRKPKPIHPTYKENRPNHKKAEKFPQGTIVEINTADTTILKKIPGIGSVYAKRIVKYRNLLGGFYSVEQLSEVYGIDAEKYQALSPWFTADPALIDSLAINQISSKRLSSHPYVNYRQAKTIERMIRKKGFIKDWNDLILLEEFPDVEVDRSPPTPTVCWMPLLPLFALWVSAARLHRNG